MPKTAKAVLDRDSWEVPPVFRWLQRLGEVEQSEMDQVFNQGVGLALMVSPFYAESIRKQFKDHGMDSWILGRIEQGAGEVVWSSPSA